MSLPGAWMRSFTPSVLELSIYYGLLLMWIGKPADPPVAPVTAVPIQHEGRPVPWRNWILMSIAAVAVIDAGYWIYERYFNSQLRISYLSVGQGDGAIVQFPGSKIMLVDAGGSFGDEFDPGERLVARFLWSRKIMHVDYLALSHPELDHFGGMIFIANNFSPSEFWAIDAPSPDRKYLKLLTALSQNQVRLQIMDTAVAPALIGGVTIRCLNPERDEMESRNNSSMVLRMEYGGNGFLFTGDLEAKGERAVVGRQSNLKSMFLKVPHHGSKTSSSETFLQAVSPQYAVMSLGYRNRYRFPAQAVLDRYQSDRVRVLRTDQVGAVMIEADRRGKVRIETGFRPLAVAPPDRQGGS